MARVVVIPEATDNVTEVAMLIRVVRATGAAVIMSHCLHYRTTSKEDDTVSVCTDCGAIAPGPNAAVDLEPAATAECPHGADGRTCGTGCLCEPCHGKPDGTASAKPANACSDHPQGCPPNSHLPGLCEHPNKEGSEDGTILVCSDCGRELSPPVNKTGNGDTDVQPESEDLGTPLG